MKKIIIFVIAGLLIAGGAYATLWEYFDGDLPPISLRGAESCGITNYTGTAEQNQALLECLEETMGQPYAEEPYIATVTHHQRHNFDGGVYTHGVSRISGTGAGNFTTLTIAEATTLAGANTFSGATSATGNFAADGGFVEGGRKTYGEVGSTSLTASDICDYKTIGITAHTADGDVDDVGVSVSFPSHATLVADCMGTAGDYKQFYIDNMSSISTHYIDLTTTGLKFSYASAAQDDFAGDELIVVDLWNDGTSLQWRFDAIDASMSYQYDD